MGDYEHLFTDEETEAQLSEEGLSRITLLHDGNARNPAAQGVHPELGRLHMNQH